MLCYFRALSDAAFSEPAEQFAYLAEQVGNVSELTTQVDYRVRVLETKDRIKTCRDYEESEGRKNTDMLNRFIVIGGPTIHSGEHMQELLLQQVIQFSFQSCCPIGLQHPNPSVSGVIYFSLNLLSLLGYQVYPSHRQQPPYKHHYLRSTVQSQEDRLRR